MVTTAPGILLSAHPGKPLVVHRTRTPPARRRLTGKPHSVTVDDAEVVVVQGLWVRSSLRSIREDATLDVSS
jgi:hypothetical protein